MQVPPVFLFLQYIIGQTENLVPAMRKNHEIFVEIKFFSPNLWTIAEKYSIINRYLISKIAGGIP